MTALIVHSADGTPIAVRARGIGPAAVIVHGAVNAAADWEAVVDCLADRCSCWTYDRRGRGASGDDADHSMDREIEDLFAVIAAAAPVAVVIGHSLGGIIALEAALRQPPLRLIVYEPPLAVAGDLRAIPGIERIEALIRDRRPEAALIEFLVGETGMPETAAEALRRSPDWPAMVEATQRLPREMRSLATLPAGVARYRGLAAPLDIINGTRSGAAVAETAKSLLAAVPKAKLHVLRDQGHAAHRAAPAMLAELLGTLVTKR